MIELLAFLCVPVAIAWLVERARRVAAEKVAKRMREAILIGNARSVEELERWL